MSAGSSASSIRRAGGPERVRALQRVLYRSAKQDPKFNLRLLCPNCHSQTSTWGGRNKGRVAA